MITVKKIDNRTFDVTIADQTTTNHRVTVDPAYHEKLTDGHISTDKLVEKSFEFLLQRESNTSILRAFELPVIGRYFPEYETTIQKMFKMPA
ncbi:MAG: hypothetical protein JRI42_06470 [Deltaproteobacteria bacterium]|nr:hypothetical protein [Deltaproteobacteria bacterium]MBW2001590.1 hypothetical protein [Deltaproteobacteria bacterium]